MRNLCITFFVMDFYSTDILCIIYYIVVEFLNFVAIASVVFYSPFHEGDVVSGGALCALVGFGDLSLGESEVLVKCVGYDSPFIDGDLFRTVVSTTEFLDFDEDYVGGRSVPPPLDIQ